MHIPEVSDDRTKFGEKIIEGRTVVMEVIWLNTLKRRALSM